MTCYIVSYDLREPGRNYEALYEAIRSYELWAHVNESVWAVVTGKKAVQVRDHLTSYIDANDRILVVRSGAEGAWRNAMCEDDWLKKHL